MADARALHNAAADWLAGQYPDALIVHELSIGSWGAALIDVAAITPTEIVGVEVKGEGDSHTRIALQAAVYSKAATRMFLLPAPTLEAKCFKAAPNSWGLLSIASGQIERAEPWEYKRKEQPPRLCTAPHQLVQCLWAEEIATLAKRLGNAFGKKLYREAAAAEIAGAIPLNTLLPAVCEILRERQWIGKSLRWASGSQVEEAA